MYVFICENEKIAYQINKWADTLGGMERYCVKAFAEAMEAIPYTLAENSGLHPMRTVTDLKRQHALGEHFAGINVRTGKITNIYEENVVQPLLVTTSAINLATECTRMLLKIDDIVLTRS